MKYPGWQALYLSFFSADLYRDVAKNWGGVAYQYLLLIVVALSAISAIVVQVSANMMLSEQNLSPVLDKWPALTIDGGKFSTDRKSPYFIDIGTDLVIDFDTRPDAKFPEDKKGWLVNSTQIVQENLTSPGESMSKFDLESQGAGLPKLVIDKQLILSWVNLLKTYVGIVIFIFGGIFTYLAVLFQTVFYALAGMIAAKVLNVDLSYSQLVRLTSVALTPVLIVDIIIRNVHPIPFWGILTIFIAIGYVIFGVSANRTESTPVVTTPLA